jgi:hypothetical protein
VFNYKTENMSDIAPIFMGEVYFRGAARPNDSRAWSRRTTISSAMRHVLVVYAVKKEDPQRVERKVAQKVF